MWCGVWAPSSGCPCPSGDALAQQADLSSMFVKLLMAMIAARTVRSIYMCRGWPSRAYCLLADPDTATATKQALRTDYEDFLRLGEAARSGKVHIQKLHKRSVFHLMSVQQLVESFKRSPKSGWELHDGLIDFVKQKSRRQVNSHINECSFNLMKNSQTINATRRYMAPHKGTAVLIDRQVARCSCVRMSHALFFGGPAPPSATMRHLCPCVLVSSCWSSHVVPHLS